MPVNFTPKKEGDAFDAASLNDSFSAFTGTDAVNDILTSMVRSRSLDTENLASLVPLSEFSPTPGFSITRTSSVALGPYTSMYPTFTAIPNSRITWPQVNIGMGETPRVAGLLVLASVEVIGVYDNLARSDAGAQDYEGCIAIEYDEPGASWANIDRTERFTTSLIDKETKYGSSPDTYKHYLTMPHTIDIRTLILPNDGVGSRGVGLVASFYKDPAAPAPTAAYGMTIGRFSLSVIPLHARYS